ncbi:MAG: hypothetical protein MJ225_02245 [Bacilli bacterium]|nr:hypothetical protein [Bacilli bacterium]
MKKRGLLLLLVPLALVSCGDKGVSFNVLYDHILNISKSSSSPYYRVVGSLDFNNEYITVDATFDKQPKGETFVPYSRYYPGFYVESIEDLDEEDTIIYQMASRSYWLRAPLKIDNTNFYALLDNGTVNSSCAFYNLTHIITSWMDDGIPNNPSSSFSYYKVLDNGGFAIGGNKVHSKIRFDNYPAYPDPVAHPEMFGPDVWDFDYAPLPCYQNFVDGKFNIEFVYDKDGWLISESLETIDYDFDASIATQVAMKANYFYKFS